MRRIETAVLLEVKAVKRVIFDLGASVSIFIMWYPQ